MTLWSKTSDCIYDLQCSSNAHMNKLIRSFFSLTLSRVPKEMKDLRWVEGFHSRMYLNENFSIFCPAQKMDVSHYVPSVIFSVVLHDICQYTLKHEHITTLSTVFTKQQRNDHIACKAQHHIVSCTIFCCHWEHQLSTLQIHHHPAIHAYMEQFHASAINLNSLSSRGQLHFYCSVAQWFFTRMLIWHFNKLCE